MQLARLKLLGAMMGDIFTEIMMISIRNRVSKWMKWMMAAWFYDVLCSSTDENDQLDQPHDSWDIFRQLQMKLLLSSK